MPSGRTILGAAVAALALATSHGPAAAQVPSTLPTTPSATTPGVGATTPPTTEVRKPRPVDESPCFGAASRDPRAPCKDPDLERVVLPTPYDAVLEPNEPCKPMRGVGPGVEACTFGVPHRRAKGTVALLGDSHATHWRAALAGVARQDRLRGISITRSGCPMTLAISRGSGRCAGWAEQVIAWLHRHPEVKTVVTSASTGSRVVADPGSTELDTAIRGYTDAWAAMPPSVRDLYVIRDVPHMRWETLGCVSDAVDAGREAGDRCAQARSVSLPPDPAAKAQRRGLAARQHLIDLTAFMCEAQWCLPVVGGALVSKDGGHLTRTFSITMGPYLARAMAAAKLPDRRRDALAARAASAPPQVAG